MNENPNVTPADVEAAIFCEHFFTAADGAGMAAAPTAFEFWHSNGHAIVDYTGLTHVGHLTAEKGYTKTPLHAKAKAPAALSLLTFCVLVTHNGHTVVGEAHCQDPAKFSTTIGREAARADAVRQLWPMVVYAARDRLKSADPESATDTQDAS